MSRPSRSLSYDVQEKFAGKRTQSVRSRSYSRSKSGAGYQGVVGGRERRGDVTFTQTGALAGLEMSAQNRCLVCTLQFEQVMLFHLL